MQNFCTRHPGTLPKPYNTAMRAQHQVGTSLLRLPLCLSVSKLLSARHELGTYSEARASSDMTPNNSAAANPRAPFSDQGHGKAADNGESCQPQQQDHLAASLSQSSRVHCSMPLVAFRQTDNNQEQDEQPGQAVEQAVQQQWQQWQQKGAYVMPRQQHQQHQQHQHQSSMPKGTYYHLPGPLSGQAAQPLVREPQHHQQQQQWSGTQRLGAPLQHIQAQNQQRHLSYQASWQQNGSSQELNHEQTTPIPHQPQQSQEQQLHWQQPQVQQLYKQQQQQQQPLNQQQVPEQQQWVYEREAEQAVAYQQQPYGYQVYTSRQPIGQSLLQQQAYNQGQGQGQLGWNSPPQPQRQQQQPQPHAIRYQQQQPQPYQQQQQPYQHQQQPQPYQQQQQPQSYQQQQQPQSYQQQQQPQSYQQQQQPHAQAYQQLQWQSHQQPQLQQQQQAGPSWSQAQQQWAHNQAQGQASDWDRNRHQQYQQWQQQGYTSGNNGSSRSSSVFPGGRRLSAASSGPRHQPLPSAVPTPGYVVPHQPLHATPGSSSTTTATSSSSSSRSVNWGSFVNGSGGRAPSNAWVSPEEHREAIQAAAHKGIQQLQWQWGVAAPAADSRGPTEQLRALAGDIIQQKLAGTLAGRSGDGPFKLFYLDTETNGFGSQDEILELYLKTDDQDLFYKRILNKVKLNANAQSVHKIHQGQLLACPLWPQVAVELLDWVQQQCGTTHTPVLVAHSAGFDASKLWQHFSWLGYQLPEPWMVFCTRDYAKHVYKVAPWPRKGGPKFKLDTLASDLGVVRVGQAHSAASDVELMVQMLQALQAHAGHSFPNQADLINWAMQQKLGCIRGIDAAARSTANDEKKGSLWQQQQQQQQQVVAVAQGVGGGGGDAQVLDVLAGGSSGLEPPCELGNTQQQQQQQGRQNKAAAVQKGGGRKKAVVQKAPESNGNSSDEVECQMMGALGGQEEGGAGAGSRRGPRKAAAAAAELQSGTGSSSYGEYEQLGEQGSGQVVGRKRRTARPAVDVPVVPVTTGGSASEGCASSSDDDKSQEQGSKQVVVRKRRTAQPATEVSVAEVSAEGPASCSDDDKPQEEGEEKVVVRKRRTARPAVEVPVAPVTTGESASEGCASSSNDDKSQEQGSKQVVVRKRRTAQPAREAPVAEVSAEGPASCSDDNKPQEEGEEKVVVRKRRTAQPAAEVPVSTSNSSSTDNEQLQLQSSMQVKERKKRTTRPAANLAAEAPADGVQEQLEDQQEQGVGKAAASSAGTSSAGVSGEAMTAPWYLENAEEQEVKGDVAWPGRELQQQMERWVGGVGQADDADAAAAALGAMAAEAWQPYAQPLSGLKKVFTPTQCTVLESVGMKTLLQVLLYAPREVQVPGRTLDLTKLQERQMVVARWQHMGGTGRVGPAACWNAALEVEVEGPEGKAVVPVALRVEQWGVHMSRGMLMCRNQAQQVQEQIQQLQLQGVAEPRVIVQGKFTYTKDGTLQLATPAAAPPKVVDPTAEQPLLLVYAEKMKLKKQVLLGTPKLPGVLPRALNYLEQQVQTEVQPGKKQRIAQAGHQVVQQQHQKNGEVATGGGVDVLGGEVLPRAVVEEQKLMGFAEALQQLHSPSSLQRYEEACRRLAFQELFLVQLAAWLGRYVQQMSSSLSTSSGDSSDADFSRGSDTDDSSSSIVSSSSNSQAVQVRDLRAVEAALAGLPYELTASQKHVLRSILRDLRGPEASIRLMQGDVGCGKTVVALLAMMAATGSGYQAALMAPTELLAEQHLQTLLTMCDAMPLSARPRVACLSSSLKPAASNALKDRIARGEVDLLVGTHALINVKKWARLGLIVIDEQHKFGVKQREKLSSSSSLNPHLLLMTATPIPRTMALVQYGAMSQSRITDMPPGRQPIATSVVQDTEEARKQVYAAIHAELDTGGRVYIVCPLVTESDASSMEGVRATEQEFERLKTAGVFGNHQCARLHGKMSAAEKTAALKAFASGETPVLISSTVVEVGIDEPEASIMLVENAERFGLAQLHQLRGRVGRGSRLSRCFLIAPAPGSSVNAQEQLERLEVLEKSSNGLDIAEADLKNRGYGEIFGTKQSGKFTGLSQVCWRQLQNTPALIEQARDSARRCIESNCITADLWGALYAYGLLAGISAGQSGGAGRTGA